MSTSLVTYLHYQPKVGPFSYFDIGQKPYYSAEEQNLGWQTFLKTQLESLLVHLEADPGFKINLSLTIPVLEFVNRESAYRKRLQKLIKAGQIELLAGQGYNSLSILVSRTLFLSELEYQLSLLAEISANTPMGFVNTALLYSDAYGEIIEGRGFAYAVVPRISWFIRESDRSLFMANSGTLKLFSAETSFSKAELNPARVILLRDLDKKDKNLRGKPVLLSDILTEEGLPQYSLPEIVALDSKEGGIESIVGNNLQKDFLTRLIALSPAVARVDDRRINADFFWLASLEHFNSLSNQSENRYKMYTKLLTMLYDLEIKLR